MTAPRAGVLPTSHLRGAVVFRRGEITKNPRKGETRDVRFTLDDGFAVLKEKIMRYLRSPPFATDGSRLVDGIVYFKDSKNVPQARFKILDEASFESLVRARWAKITQADADLLVLGTPANDDFGMRVASSFLFELFVYLTPPAGSTLQSLRRATASRIAESAEAVAAFTRNGPTLGPIATTHVVVTHARQPDGTPVRLPDDNTTRQAMALDTAIADMACAQSARDASRDVAEIEIQIGGAWVKLPVRIASLRSALRLPQHDIFTQGIFHDFTPVPSAVAPQDDVLDEDHMSDEEHSTVV
ncbi:hypothetical protein P43SY_009983 [Pythium insidiosum]|uniref:Uncharacterized protein n=1 Tax=Pythium insidiosum TaxID=114742 RepID=A0AAD5Q5J8_PYTIN|nr:hypothetical protein P43SY_009983 [Pythium insidiosum]